MIICDKVNKFVLKDLDLHLPKGTTLGITGFSGSGTTTFLKLVSGLLQPDSGTVRTLRLDPVKNTRELSRRISVLFADIPVFNETLSVMNGLFEMKTVYGIKDDKFSERLNHISETLGFSESLNTKIKSLSLGQKRRAELGLTFLRDADLYIFDDPCIGLDQNGKAAFYKLSEEMKKAGKTILISSHSMEDISNLSDRILLLDKGNAVFYGSKEEFYKRLAPMEESFLEVQGQLPDISDLELERYYVEKNRMTILYNSNHVSSKELLERISSTSKIKSVSIRRANLTENIKSLKSGRNEK